MMKTSRALPGFVFSAIEWAVPASTCDAHYDYDWREHSVMVQSRGAVDEHRNPPIGSQPTGERQ
jgi:hypothetical protein